MKKPTAAPEKPTAKVVDIFTDGACGGNPGPGGRGVRRPVAAMRK